METLISPWMMYLLSITSALNVVAAVCLMGTGIIFLKDDSEDLSTRRWIFTGVIAVVSLLILIFVPNKQEMIAIIATTTITPDNFPIDLQEYITNLVKVCGAIK